MLRPLSPVSYRSYKLRPPKRSPLQACRVVGAEEVSAPPPQKKIIQGVFSPPKPCGLLCLLAQYCVDRRLSVEPGGCTLPLPAQCCVGRRQPFERWHHTSVSQPGTLFGSRCIM
ncbi:Hypothetical predicted protein [Podarcis lilfordi]|uniref:Uncharacterized protein n=1 Tax=Podarcis lilfordi TaxID=74358 RepID=A0AA35PKZ0_9SAUR|nr:Hypothetical predicted protein [Podarcis lilfordi]